MSPAEIRATPAASLAADKAETKRQLQKKHVDANWHIPTLRFKSNDLTSAGAQKFFGSTNVATLMREAVVAVNETLYVSPEKQNKTPTAITLYLETMGGVAYTTGASIDPVHIKEIHLSTDYISGIPEERVASEILGVMRHEMVHVWQYDAQGTTPGGLIEGIADWVRLQHDLAPPHWKRGGTKWDDGYQNTAYFLQWLEERFGTGTVVWINSQLKGKKYNPNIFKTASGGLTVDELWSEYKVQYELDTLQKSKENENMNNPTECKDTDKANERREEYAKDEEDEDVVVVDKDCPRIYHASNPPATANDIPHLETEDGKTTLTLPAARAASLRSRDSLPSSEDDSSYDPFPFDADTAVAEIMRKRLKNLIFDGRMDGKRFIREFEGFVNRVNPDMSDEDKRLLLTTSFKGDEVNFWYEETDLEDEMSYTVLKDLLQKRFVGSSARKARIVERDAKME